MQMLRQHELLQVSGGDGRVEGGGGPGYLTIVVPIHFQGEAATPENIARIEAQLESQWSYDTGTYHVNMDVVTNGDPATSNTVNLYWGATPSSVDPQTGTTYQNSGHSYVDPQQNAPDIGYWSMADINGVAINGSLAAHGDHTFSHEVGHLLGLADNGTGIMDIGNGTAISTAQIDWMIAGGQITATENWQDLNQFSNSPIGLEWSNYYNSWYDPYSGYYYDYNSGYYYNPDQNWWYDSGSGYYYDGYAGAWYDSGSNSYYMDAYQAWVSYDYYWWYYYYGSYGC